MGKKKVWQFFFCDSSALYSIRTNSSFSQLSFVCQHFIYFPRKRKVKIFTRVSMTLGFKLHLPNTHAKMLSCRKKNLIYVKYPWRLRRARTKMASKQQRQNVATNVA